jgi:hypothetical protein
LCDATNSTSDAKGGLFRRRKLSATFENETICAGLDGAANLKIAASSGGRANRPFLGGEHSCGETRRKWTRHGYMNQSANSKTQKSPISKAEHRYPEKSQAFTSTARTTSTSLHQRRKGCVCGRKIGIIQNVSKYGDSDE